MKKNTSAVFFEWSVMANPPNYKERSGKSETVMVPVLGRHRDHDRDFMIKHSDAL